MSDIGTAIEVGTRLAPFVIDLVQTLIDLGHSPEEAEEIVKRDIMSRADIYKSQRDKDLEDLKKKHGLEAHSSIGAAAAAAADDGEFGEP